MERNPHVLVEVDDFKHAIALGKDLQGVTVPVAVEVTAQWFASLREYYVQVGRDLERI